MIDFDRESVVRALRKHDFLDDENYNNMLQRGLSNVKFYLFHDSDFQYISLVYNGNLEDEGYIDILLKDFLATLKDIIYDGGEDDWWYNEGSLARDFFDIDIEYIKQNTFEDDEDNLKTIIIAKLTYNLDIDLNAYTSDEEDFYNEDFLNSINGIDNLFSSTIYHICEEAYVFDRLEEELENYHETDPDSFLYGALGGLGSELDDCECDLLDI